MTPSPNAYNIKAEIEDKYLIIWFILIFRKDKKYG
jgi:hypothetical protein